MISILEYFLLGIVFCVVVNPLLEEITTVLLQCLAVISGYLKVIVTKQSVTITKLQDEVLNDEKTKTKKIGFSYEEDDE